MVLSGNGTNTQGQPNKKKTEKEKESREEGEEKRDIRNKKEKVTVKKQSKGGKGKGSNTYITSDIAYIGMAGLEWRTHSPTRSRKRSSWGKKCDGKSCHFRRGLNFFTLSNKPFIHSRFFLLRA